MKQLLPLLLVFGSLSLSMQAHPPRAGAGLGGKKALTLPQGADDWDGIGTYTLGSGGSATTVKLYVYDSDSVADKQARRGHTLVGRTYPNFFSIHAVYRVGDGRWKHQELYRVARVGFHKVVEAKPEAVKLQVRSKLILFPDAEGSLPDWLDEQQIREIYEPVTMTLSVKDGSLVLE
jgi:hypothetical protein